jgi:hypothetical protein
VLGEELVDNLGQKLVRNKRRVFAVGNNDAGDTFGPTVGMECVRFLLNVLALSGLRALCDRLGE